MGLLNEIESAATNSTIPIVDLLRKCKVLAARLKHQEFADWIGNELNGYSDKKQIPSYRVIKLPSPTGHFSGAFGSGLKNAVIPIGTIPEEIRKFATHLEMNQPIAEIEELSSAGKKTLSYPWSGDMVALMQRHPIYDGMVLMSAHSSLSGATIKAIVDTVRTKVLDYVLAIQVENPDADRAKPSDPPPIPATTLNQTFHTTIVGGQANIGGQGDQTIGGDNKSVVNKDVINFAKDKEIIKLLSNLNTAATTLNAVEREESQFALKKVEEQLQSKQPDFSRVKNYLDITAKIAALAPYAQQLIHYLAQHF